MTRKSNPKTLRAIKNQLTLWWSDFKRISYIDVHWLIIWLIIYLGFLTLDIIYPGYIGSSLLKYAGIFLCVIYAYRKYRNDNKLIIALFFTFLADTILVWTTKYAIGVFVFCFAQYIHFLRLSTISKRTIGVFSVIISLLVFIDALQGGNIIYSLAAFYGILLITNCLIARQRCREKPNDFKNRCAHYGFIAFICCDTCVALRFLMINNIISPFLLPLVSYLVWVFYYPSQILLANSSTKEANKKKARVAKSHPIS